MVDRPITPALGDKLNELERRLAWVRNLALASLLLLTAAVLLALLGIGALVSAARDKASESNDQSKRNADDIAAANYVLRRAFEKLDDIDRVARQLAGEPAPEPTPLPPAIANATPPSSLPTATTAPRAAVTSTTGTARSASPSSAATAPSTSPPTTTTTTHPPPPTSSSSTTTPCSITLPGGSCVLR